MQSTSNITNICERKFSLKFLVLRLFLVIVPCGITASLSKEDEDALINTCKEVETKLKKAGLRVYGDYRDNYSPG
ncbi:unnamed protein product, partial [Rotaria sordida]